MFVTSKGQVIVYAGAIMVLFIFVIMLLNTRTGEGGEANLHRVGFNQAIGIALAGAAKALEF